MEAIKSVRWIREYGFALGVAAFGVVIALSTFSVFRVIQFSREVAHAHEVLEVVGDMETVFERAETMKRGYLLTANPYFLDLFKATSEQGRRQIAHLMELVAPDTGLLEKAQLLKNLFEAHMLDFDGISSRGGHSQEDSLTDFQVQPVFKIREVSRALVDAERHLLEDRQARQTAMAEALIVYMITGIVIALFFIFASYSAWQQKLRIEQDHARWLQSIFESIGDGVFVVDKDGRIIQHNSAVETLLGLYFRKLSCLKELMRFNSVSEQESPVLKALSGQPAVAEITVNSEDPEVPRRLVNVDARPVQTIDGQILGAVAVVRDITQRRAIEREWRAARESALEALRLKTEFLATMSHEIRTPMNGVIGMSTLLMNTPLNAEQKSFVQTIRSSAETLVALINQVLDHAKIESGTVTFERRDFRVRDIFADVIDLFRYEAGEKNIGLSLEWDQALPEAATGDPQRLRQIVTNLVGNAVKFTDQGGVRVVVRPQPLSENSFYLCVKVVDSGCGIAKEAQGQLFQKFAQVHDKRYAFKVGSGLGLMICRQLLQGMGGEIGVESEEGQGATFWFRLPMGRSRTLPPPAACSQLALKKFYGCVLVAEDQVINRTVISKYLETLGLTPIIVENGEQAVIEAKARLPDLVLMDCQMPVMDGYEATAQIRRLTGGAQIPILALTAEGMNTHRQRCLDAGMNDYIAKPVDIFDLQAKLEKHLHEASEFNVEALKRLSGFEVEGEPLFNSLLRDLRRTGEEQVSAMEQAFAANDIQRLRFLAHGLKSTSRSLGLERVGQLCHELEKTAFDCADAQAHILSLRTALQRGLNWCESRLDS